MYLRVKRLHGIDKFDHQCQLRLGVLREAKIIVGGIYLCHELKDLFLNY